MKNSIKLVVIIGILLSFWACKNEDVVVRYPKSTPRIDTATVAEQQITYGDSIHLRVGVSDKVAPLSTLKVKIVVNNNEVTSEVIRTKGNHASVKRTYRVPFEANRPDNAPVEIHLTSVNVSGIQKDTVISSTIAKRPVITELYIVPDLGSGNATKLDLVNADSLLYKAKGLQLSTSFNYKLATKLDRFKRIDWSGLVFGKVGDGIGLIDKTGESINATDATLVGISEFTFDALHFTSKLGGKLLEPVTTLDVIADLPLHPASLINNIDFRGGNIYFGENVEVTFSGITTDLANSISPDYFEVTAANKAKFLGKTGLYKAYYLTTKNYLYIEPQPETLYPDALWICGTGFGRPSAPYEATASWNWNSPLDYMPCRLIAPGVYQATMYCKNTPNTDGNKYGTLDFKFFHKRGWWDGHEEWGVNYTVSPPFLGPTDTNGNINVLSEEVVDGVYRFTLNQNDKTITAVKLK
ncbi:MAG: DUF5016 domain-containing protein [Methylococcaceae bacterium]|nr:DUF5016 domain-containing protein [Prolixibacteraceae bacterium]